MTKVQNILYLKYGKILQLWYTCASANNKITSINLHIVIDNEVPYVRELHVSTVPSHHSAS